MDINFDVTFTVKWSINEERCLRTFLPVIISPEFFIRIFNIVPRRLSRCRDSNSDSFFLFLFFFFFITKWYKGGTGREEENGKEDRKLAELEKMRELGNWKSPVEN